MFIVTKIKDKIRIDPNNFDKEYTIAIQNEIHTKYCNKVLGNVGHCVSLYEIISIGDPYIIPGDGASYTEVIFSMMIFRPFLGETLTGTIVKSDYEKGLSISLGFFYDIIIPPHLFQENTEFNSEDNIWVWKYGEDEEDEMLHLDMHEKIRFVVQSIQFEGEESLSKPPKIDPTGIVYKPNEAPMVIYGRINESGLGCLRWWQNEQSDEILEETL
jgi:DNA-directed RNA polymerase III subunit RPC8